MSLASFTPNNIAWLQIFNFVVLFVSKNSKNIRKVFSYNLLFWGTFFGHIFLPEIYKWLKIRTLKRTATNIWTLLIKTKGMSGVGFMRDGVHIQSLSKEYSREKGWEQIIYSIFHNHYCHNYSFDIFFQFCCSCSDIFVIFFMCKMYRQSQIRNHSYKESISLYLIAKFLFKAVSQKNIFLPFYNT